MREFLGILLGFLGILWDTIHEGSSLSFIATKSLDLRKPRLDLIPSRKGIRILKGSPNAPVGRPDVRPTHATVDRAGRPRRSTAPNREQPCFQLVDRAVDRYLPVHVRARRSIGRSTGLLHRSTGRSTGSTIWLAQCAVSRSLIFDLCANFLYLLSPTITTSVKIFQI